MPKIKLIGALDAERKHTLRDTLLSAKGEEITLSEGEVSMCVFLAAEEARRWRKSNKDATVRRENDKALREAYKDPEIQAILAAKGIKVAS